jgi:hypothetical protein
MALSAKISFISGTLLVIAFDFIKLIELTVYYRWSAGSIKTATS